MAIYLEEYKGDSVPVARKDLNRWILALAPIASRGIGKIRPRDPIPGGRRVTPKYLDDLVREIVFRRDGRKCLKCGKTTRLQPHHIYTRAIRHLRWAIDNVITLCAGCHMNWGHRNHGAVLSFWRKVIGDARMDALILDAGKPRKVELVFVAMALERGTAV